VPRGAETPALYVQAPVLALIWGLLALPLAWREKRLRAGVATALIVLGGLLVLIMSSAAWSLLPPPRTIGSSPWLRFPRAPGPFATNIAGGPNPVHVGGGVRVVGSTGEGDLVLKRTTDGSQPVPVELSTQLSAPVVLGRIATAASAALLLALAPTAAVLRRRRRRQRLQPPRRTTRRSCSRTSPQPPPRALPTPKATLRRGLLFLARAAMAILAITLTLERKVATRHELATTRT
jgi:hypothetical protein